MSSTGTEIAIAGAGVGGLTAAIALAMQGHRVTIYERAPQLRVGGGALILWCNALKMLGQIELRDRMLALASAQRVETAEYRQQGGAFLTSMPVGELGRRHGAESVVLARRDLVEALYAAARPTSKIHFGVGVDDHRDAGDAVHLSLTDGTRARCHVLVGADGVHSSVRASLKLDRSLRDLHQDLWVATTTLRPRELEPGMTTATLGAGSRFWHALLGDERTFWYATMRTDGFKRPPNDLAELAEAFKDWHDPIPALIRATRPEDALRTPMRDRAPSAPWGRGRVTLLGDAAHAMTPDLGQGACQAIESAVVLARCLGADRDVVEGLEAYERLRFPRAADVTRMSFLAATTSAVSHPTLCSVRDASMRLGLRASAASHLDWLFRGPT